MRKAQKQEIMDMLQTLHEAHEEIRNNIDRKNYILAQDLLSQCQEGAISIGTAIETFEGEGFVTVGYIETYCDIVFKCHEELNGNDANANKLYKNLKKQLLRIESSVKNDISVRKEVAFFPYKASMWDSLESVYLAAKEDPDCDAYCVPIPYYDRNPDGSLGQMHYEGREYPKNIEVIDWQTYNFEERKPDVIYIHNPYDDWNLVTCVHPRYFSNNLKKYTDKLVYIPYFVLGEIEPDNQEVIDKMKHFVWTPGVINADKVIVQSEKMKQIYVNEYLKAAQANGLQGKHIDRNYLEEKFLGFGSPKFDKVLNTKKEDLELPEDWLRIIQKPDGSWKKIIFYNTSIAALLENNEKMLEKMQDVFRILKENKEEVALLWRPHPLIKATVSAMRPQLWMEYEKIVNQYKEEGWGIYDDSADMDRAVVLSDAYYGDQSSVVQVYQKTEKPVMIQNPKLTDELWNTYVSTDKFKISIQDAICYDGKIWYCAQYYNGLFAYDMKTNVTEYIGSFPNEDQKAYLFETVDRVGDKLYFVPSFAGSIAIYDTNKKQFSSIDLDKKYIGDNNNTKYMATQIYGKYIYIFPAIAKSIIKIDTENDTASYISEWIEEANYLSNNKNDAYFRKQCVLVGDKIVVPFCNMNAIFEYDCREDKYRIIKIGQENESYSGICKENDSFWLLPRRGSRLINIGKEYDEIGDVIINDSENEIRNYVAIINHNGVLKVFTVESDVSVSSSIEKIHIQEGQYSFAKADGNMLQYYDLNSSVIHLIRNGNEEEYLIEVMKNDIDQKIVFDNYRRLIGEKSIIGEKRQINIGTMIAGLEEICNGTNSSIALS